MLMANMVAFSQLTREVAKAMDVSAARFAVCTSAQVIAEANFAILLEYEAGGPVETASSGCTLDPKLEITIGDEPSGAAADGRVLVERLRERTPEGQTLSAGIAVCDGVEPPPVLVGRTDEALYEAKRSGRDRVVSVDAA